MTRLIDRHITQANCLCCVRKRFSCIRRSGSESVLLAWSLWRLSATVQDGRTQLTDADKIVWTPYIRHCMLSEHLNIKIYSHVVFFFVWGRNVLYHIKGGKKH